MAEPDPVTSIAKAIEELSKATHKALESGDKAGAYLAGTFKGAISEYAATLHDTAKFRRIRNLANQLEKTLPALEKLRVAGGSFREIPARNFPILLDAMSDESDDQLQAVWAAYLVRAMSPSDDAPTVERAMVGIIRQLEPDDLPVLSVILAADLEVERVAATRLTKDDFSVNETKLAQSLDRLTAIGLLNSDNSGGASFAPSGEGVGRVDIFLYKWAEYSTTTLMLRFARAVGPLSAALDS